MPTDFDAILQTNLARVFSEADPTRRLDAIREIYAPDAVLYETDHAAEGHEAISAAVTELLAHLPPGARFRPIRPALGHHGIARMQWRGESADGTLLVTGLDVAKIEEGAIRSLHVFVDPPTA